MGNRRFSRKRLFESEKLGKAVDLEAGAGIKDAIVSATQHRNGAEIITEIAVDLGTSKADIVGGGLANDVIGVASQNSFLTRLSVSKFGYITEIRGVVVEAILDDGDVAVDVDLLTDDAVIATAGTPATNNKIVVDGLSTLGKDESNSNTFHANMQDSTPAYLYICNGGAETTSNSIDAGKILIYIHGFEAPSDI